MVEFWSTMIGVGTGIVGWNIGGLISENLRGVSWPGRRSPIGRAIEVSLRDEPARWAFSRYHATHDSGVDLWVANEIYGLGYSEKGDASPRDGMLTKADKPAIWRHCQNRLDEAARLKLAPADGAGHRTASTTDANSASGMNNQ